MDPKKQMGVKNSTYKLIYKLKKARQTMKNNANVKVE